MLLLLYCLPLLFEVLQRSDSCFVCYIVYHYSWRFYRGGVHVVVVFILCTTTVLGLTEEWFMLLLFCLSLLFKIWQRSGSCCFCYIIYHYCLRLDRGVAHVIVILSTISVKDFTEEWFMLLLLLYCRMLLF